MAKREIDDATREILRQSVITGNLLKLPRQLDRATYVAVDKVLRGVQVRVLPPYPHRNRITPPWWSS